jgi:hypothetical protein
MSMFLENEKTDIKNKKVFRNKKDNIFEAL